MAEPDEIAIGIAHIEGVEALPADRGAGLGQAAPPVLAGLRRDAQREAMPAGGAVAAAGPALGALDGEEGALAQVQPDGARAALVLPATEDGQSQQAGVEALGARQVGDDDGDVVDPQAALLGSFETAGWSATQKRQGRAAHSPA